ncbi:citrate (Si)-synthase [Maribellus comscasis]|uniref:citrate synthase (unknown stereospecificity) n=1 Tax=Maribellus comscasis TaxID=2681766 RepID=A0A6I6JSU6_9BACT|nr:citrate (Si)-synthase [Maribellus comscasis]QGY43207.1 citrate (Si)-synthase [Maribellus comscasis]
MKKLKENVRLRIETQGREIARILENYSDTEIGKVTVKHLMGGMRGLQAMVCNTSYVDPQKGLFVGGFDVPAFSGKTPEEILYLLCTGVFPKKDALTELRDELAKRHEVPRHVWPLLRNLPKDTHPMTMLSMGILAMDSQSVFKQKYSEGIPKKEHWEYTLEDSLNLIAKLPELAAGIYRIRFFDGELISYAPSLDWAENLVHMLGIETADSSFADFMRLYLVLHCDHEGGNVSAFTARVVNSALSNIYYAASAGLNGLAGPLHGLANQECLRFIQRIHDQLGKSPGKEEIRSYVLKTLDSGNVIPGYGHAVLRATDPRFTAFLKFSGKYCDTTPYLQTVKDLYAVVPGLLKTYKGGKVANPYPNVDAISGTLLHYYGLEHFDYYTVLFGVSRILGFCAQNTIARGLNQPIIRPKSVTNKWLLDFLGKASKDIKHQKTMSIKFPRKKQTRESLKRE